ncbi:hypothetical protein ACF0H5_020489 [Mactra antiquata]
MNRLKETQRDIIRKQTAEDKMLELSQIHVRTENPQMVQPKKADALRVTQRALIREQNEADRKREYIQQQQQLYQQQQSNNAEAGSEKMGIYDSGTVRKSRAPLGLKVLALVIGLAILVGGVVALILFVKKDANRAKPGAIVDKPKPLPVCSNLTLSLGGPLEFTCNIKPNGTVKAEFVESVVYPGASPKFECREDREGNTTCTYSNSVSCSTKGDIRVSFYDSYLKASQKVVRTEVFSLTIFAPWPRATITQSLTEENLNGSFHLECNMWRTCYLYEMVFVAGNFSIGENKTCTSEYTEEDGYIIKCDTTVSSEVIYDYGNGERFYCKTSLGNTEVDSVEFVLPLCEDYNSRNPDCRNGSSLYDCDDIDDVSDISCNDKCEIITLCLGARKNIIADDDDEDCNTKCELSWCRKRENDEIDRSGRMPFQELLCSNP